MIEALFVPKTDAGVHRNRNSAFIAEKEVQSSVPRYHALLAVSLEAAAHTVLSRTRQMKAKAGKNRYKTFLIEKKDTYIQAFFRQESLFF